MQWYYAANGSQLGPVAQTEFEALVRSGAVGPDTLVWRDGMAGWVAYREVASTAGGASQSVAPGQARCAECGEAFAMDDMVQFEKVHVCANCKPLFFQKIREGVPTGGAGIWRHKKQLVTRLDPVLPTRCVKCNAPTEEPQKKRKLYWHSPVVYAALLLNVIIYVIVAMIARKQTVAMLSICREHRIKRRNVILISWLLVVASFVALCIGISNESGPLMGVAAVLFLGGVIFGLVKGRLIYAHKIDKERVWIGGCGQKFLEQFPEWTGV